MNEITYNAERQNLAILNIAIDTIVSSSNASQVRQAGERTSHIEALYEDIADQGQQIPITFRNKGKRADGTSINEILDGNHRFAAIKKLYQDTGDSKYSTIKAVEKKFKNDYSYIAYQIKANNHKNPALKSTVEDAIVVLKHFVFSPKPIVGAPPVIACLHNSSHMNITDPGQYAKMLKKAVKFYWPEYTTKKVNSIVSRFQNDPKLPGKFAAWNATSVRNEFKLWADKEEIVIGTHKPNGEENYSVLPIKNDNWIDHSLMGLAFREKTENGISHENIAIIFWKDISGKTSKQLDDQRIRMIKRINERNRSPVLAKRVKMIDAIYIAPQKRDAGVEVGFFKVQKTSKGIFSTKSVPDTGWNTTT